MREKYDSSIVMRGNSSNFFVVVVSNIREGRAVEEEKEDGKEGVLRSF